MKTLILQRPVIAVTGSAGKTTTKEMIASILQRRWNIFKTKGNWNSYPFTAKYVKQIKAIHQAVVLEYGMTNKGDIQKHCQYIRPNIGVITNVGTAHIGNFNGSIKGVASAKSELIKHMKQAGTLILNADDFNSKYLQKQGFTGKIITVGINKKADYQAHRIQYKEDGMSFQVQLNGKKQTFLVPVYGKHNVYNALIAIAVAHQLKFTAAQMKAGFQSYEKLERRLRVYRLKSEIRVIDDTFSANPHATKAAINVLARIGKKNKIAVLGSMMQMGSYSRKAHRSVGRYAAKKNIHYLFTLGKEAKQIKLGAIETGFPAAQAVHFVSREKLHPLLLKKIKPGSTILVKGSHDMQMNKTVEFLRKSL